MTGNLIKNLLGLGDVTGEVQKHSSTKNIVIFAHHDDRGENCKIKFENFFIIFIIYELRRQGQKN